MSQSPYQNAINFVSAGPMMQPNICEQQEDMGVVRQTKKRKNDLGSIVDSLYQATLRSRPGEQPPVRSSQRKNRNEVYALANSMLVKDIHLNGIKFSRDIELCRGINTPINHGDFILVLRLDGRIVVISEEAEQHLGKSMRSLYSQCINMFECLDKADGDQLRSILAESERDQGKEHQLVCTFRLPKGKRPSRINEDIKQINMAGHFYSCHDSTTTTGEHEKLFVARCHALVSKTTNESSSSQSDYMLTNSHTVIKMKLNDDMTISDASTNVEDILGFRRHELIGMWFGRILASDDLSKFENNRIQCFQSEQALTATSTTTTSSTATAATLNNICDIFDVYTKNGDGRLTFLYQIRPIRERRARTPKFLVTAQLIDPSLRNKYVEYVQFESATNKKSVKVEQVNLVSSSVSKTSEDTLLAHSPSLSGGLLMFDNVSQHVDAHQQFSPLCRSLSDFVAPVDLNEFVWPDQLFSFDFQPQYPVANHFEFACSDDQAISNCFDINCDQYFMENELY